MQRRQTIDGDYAFNGRQDHSVYILEAHKQHGGGGSGAQAVGTLQPNEATGICH